MSFATQAEYNSELVAVLQLSRQIRDLRLDEMLDAMHRASSFGPILDPTAFRKADTDLQKQTDLVRSARLFQLAAQTVDAEGMLARLGEKP